MRQLIALSVLLSSLWTATPAAATTATTFGVTASNFLFCDSNPQVKLAPDATVSYGPNPACSPADLARLPLAIKAGDTVAFEYVDFACSALSGCPGHNVVFDNGPSQAVPFKAALTDLASMRPIIFSRTFNEVGTYRYRCTLHAATMVGSIVVD